MRAEAYLEAREGRIASHEARGLATAILGDLGDLVAYALDPSFGTVRYGERIAASAPRFDTIRSALDSSALLTAAYAPLLDAGWNRLGEAPALLLISVPFPGASSEPWPAPGPLAAYSAVLRESYSVEAISRPSSGAWSTEGYSISATTCASDAATVPSIPFWRSRPGLQSSAYSGLCIAAPTAESLRRASTPRTRHSWRRMEVPPRPAHVAEPHAMQRIGWHARKKRPLYPWRPITRAARSDATYKSSIRTTPCTAYGPTPPGSSTHWRMAAIGAAALSATRSSNTCPASHPSRSRASSSRPTQRQREPAWTGIHFVDEAMPMASLLAFAAENRIRAARGKKSFHFWGNVRFDSSWTEDRCEYLSAAGLIAVSGGIEIATEGGLTATGKGFDLAGLARALVAMKRAGLLVHAYLIYGFPGQSRQDILDSAEVCRQLIASGLVDSAFWHRFVLSTAFQDVRRMAGSRASWQAESLALPRAHGFFRDFANDLGFAGERDFDEFDGPLAAELEAWMNGEGLEKVVSRSGSRRTGLAPDLVESLIEKAESDLDGARLGREGRAHWVAGLPAARAVDATRSRLAWTYRGEARELVLPRGAADRAAARLGALASARDGVASTDMVAELSALEGMGPDVIDELRSSGLVVV